jgi:hypothetical protein
MNMVDSSGAVLLLLGVGVKRFRVVGVEPEV